MSEQDTARMREIAELVAGPEQHDNEIVHGEADSILVSVLREHGEHELADAFTSARTQFWYA